MKRLQLTRYDSRDTLMRFTLRQDQRTKRVNYAKQTQFAECSNDVCPVTTKYYETVPLHRRRQNKPNQTQSNPISTPLRRKQTQTNPILNQSRPAVPQFLLFPFYFLLTSATREFRVFAQPQDCGADKDNSRIAL